mgnify:CR=1 FL=1
MKHKFSVFDYVLLSAMVVHIILGVLVIVFSNDVFEKNNIFIGSILMASGVPSLLIFLSVDGHKNFRKFPYLASSIIAFVIGLIFILFNEITLDHMFLAIGIFDIVRGLYEIVDASLEIKVNKLEIMEVASAAGDVIFGILLCIKLSEGYKNHLIFMGAALLLVGIKFLLDLIFDLKSNG